MHELAVTKSILKLVLNQVELHDGKEVVKIHLVIGEMRNLEEEWLQRYFDYIAKGTPAAGAVIQVTKKPVRFACKACGNTFGANLHADQKLVCSHCGSFEYDLASGRELLVEQVEIR